MKKFNYNRIILGAVVFWAVISFLNGLANQAPARTIETLDYSSFIQAVRNETVKEIRLSHDKTTIRGIKKNGDQFISHNPSDPKLVDELWQKKLLSNKTHFQALLFLGFWVVCFLILFCSLYFGTLVERLFLQIAKHLDLATVVPS
jgi:ATP-dependent Zn protease